MTPLELRMFYKADTGFAPTYGRTQEQQAGSCNYKGGLTHEYAEWLEMNHLDMTLSKKFRTRYQQDKGISGTYYSRYHVLCYTKDYKEWLEEQQCNGLSSLTIKWCERNESY